MKISEIAAYLKKVSGEIQDYAAQNDDMDLPDEVVLPFITNFLTKNLIDLSSLSLTPSPVKDTPASDR